MRRLLIDECVNRLIVLPPFLQLAECVFVADLSAGALDIDVLALAREEGFLLLTEDNDFGRLIFAERRPPPGVILVTMPNRTPAERAARVIAEAGSAFAKAEGGLFVIDYERSRRRPFPDYGPR